MTCRWIDSDHPRQLEDGNPCPQPHCDSCGHRHVQPEALTCPSCVGDVRDDLRLIASLSTGLPEEAEERGIDSEAADLAGPAADPEQWRQRGRHGHRWDNDAQIGGEGHPLWVLGTWDMLVREHLSQPTTLRVTIARASDYLASHLTRLAQDGDFPFAVLRQELRACRGHLEDVMRDGEQRDTGAPCLDCGTRQVRVWATSAADDGWQCPRCRTQSTQAQYLQAVRADYAVQRVDLEYLPAEDCAEVLDVTRGSITGWASKGLVRKRIAFGRVTYRVDDVRNAKNAAALVSSEEIS